MKSQIKQKSGKFCPSKLGIFELPMKLAEINILTIGIVQNWVTVRRDSKMCANNKYVILQEQNNVGRMNSVNFFNLVVSQEERKKKRNILKLKFNYSSENTIQNNLNFLSVLQKKDMQKSMSQKICKRLMKEPSFLQIFALELNIIQIYTLFFLFL